MARPLIEYVKRVFLGDLDVSYKMVAYGYDKDKPLGNGRYGVKEVRKKVVTLHVERGENIDFLNYLPDNLTIQIGNTFYRKGGASFVYEYLNQSFDYNHSLDTEDMEIHIMFDGGLLGDSP